MRSFILLNKSFFIHNNSAFAYSVRLRHATLFLINFLLDQKVTKAVRKFLQNYGSVFPPKPKLFISEKLNSYIAFS